MRTFIVASAMTLTLALIGCAAQTQAAVSPPTQVQANPPFQAGRDYQVLPGKVQTQSGERNEVVEFFMYPCEHCYVFDPILKAWEDRQTEDVVLRRIPIALGAMGTRYARIFYSAQLLGVFDKVHAQSFRSFHRDKQFFTSDDEVREFFVAQGVDAAAFERTFNSAQVNQKLNQGALLAQLYGITEVPSLGVNGRYRIAARPSGTYQRFLKIADYLINASVDTASIPTR